ncbi:hypothetical protein FFIC_200050, partial [Fructobacillus ficulneus]
RLIDVTSLFLLVAYGHDTAYLIQLSGEAYPGLTKELVRL